MWRVLKWFLATLLTLTALLVATALVILRWPNLVINERTLPWLAARLESATGIALHWKEGNLNVESIAWLEKRVRLSFRDVCAINDKKPEERLRACFDVFAVNVAVDFSGLKIRITEAGPVNILNGKILVRRPESPPDQKGDTAHKERSGPQPLPRWVRWGLGAPLHPVRIELKEVQLVQGKERYEAALDLSARKGIDGKPATRLKLSARLPDGASVRARAEATAQMGPGKPREQPLLLGHRIEGEYRDKSIRVALQTDGHFQLGPETQTLEERGNATIVAPGFRGPIRLNDCRIGFFPERTSLDCTAQAPLPVPPKTLPRLHIPADLKARVTAALNPMPFPPDFSAPWNGQVTVRVDPFLTPLLQGEGQLVSQISGIPREFPRDWKLDTNVDLRLGVRSFEHLVNQLRKTEWAIPAPFHVLKGQINLAVHGRTDIFGGSLPLELTTRLSSPTQALDTDTRGVLHLSALTRTEPARPDSRGPRGQQAGTAALNPNGNHDGPAARLELRSVLSDVKLELPDVGLEVPPQLLPDRRFKTEAEDRSDRDRESSGSAFRYDIRVETPADQPVELLSNLAKQPVPVSLRMRFQNDAPLAGEVRIARFPLKLFRRDAQMEHFHLNLDDPLDESPLDGKIRVAYTDYTVTILLLGTAGKPRIRLVSDPPLPEEQLVAVLLFGKPLEELDPDQTESVGSTRSALADGALGLASLYVLASTPIQSLGYNPSTGQFNLKVRLGAGTSLNVGSAGGDVSEIGLRKRLGPHWTITTDVTRSTETRERTGSAYLEWHNRY